MRWKEEAGTIRRWADTALTAEGPPEEMPDRYSVESAQSAIRNVFSEFRYAKILHAPVRFANAGSPVAIHASVLGARKKLRLTLFHRTAGEGFRFASTEMQQQDDNIYSALIPASKPGDTILYFIKAADETEYFHGSEKEPHALAIRPERVPRPQISHTDIPKTRVGSDVRVEAKLAMAGKSRAVRLHYRHLDQSEDFRVVEMQSRGNSVYEARIPGEFVVPNWDLVYAIEAVDSYGAGAFYPDLDQRQPFVVIRVEPR